MKRLLLPALLSLFLAAPAAQAAGVGAFAGKMDTDSLGDGNVYGAQLEFDFFPMVSLLVRGGYAEGFDEFRFVGRSGTLVADDIAVVPVEAGLLLRPPALFGLLGLYAGGGAGWYGVPGFDVSQGRAVVAETDDVTDLVGWWVAGGVEIGVPSFRVFGEVKYVDASEDGLDIEFKRRPDLGKLNADLDLSGVAFLAGIRFDW